MSRTSDVDFATFCDLRDFTDFELAYIERAARATVAYAKWLAKKREHMSERFSEETAFTVLAPWDDEPQLSMQMHSGAVLQARQMVPHLTRGGLRPNRGARGYSISKTRQGTYRVRMNANRQYLGLFPSEYSAHQAGRAAVEELRAS